MKAVDIKDFKSKTMNEKDFHRTKLLLEIYRDVVWRLEENLIDIDDSTYETAGKHLRDLTGFLSLEFDTELNRKQIEEQLLCIMETKQFIDLIDKALLKLKSYPGQGELYFEILYKQYIVKHKYDEKEILESINLERTTFYRRKKEAINLFGIILWGFVLPALKELWPE